MTSNGKRAINLHNRLEATASNKCGTATTATTTPPTKVHSYPKFNLALETVNSRTMPSMNRDQSMSRFTVAKVDAREKEEEDYGEKADGIEAPATAAFYTSSSGEEEEEEREEEEKGEKKKKKRKISINSEYDKEISSSLLLERTESGKSMKKTSGKQVQFTVGATNAKNDGAGHENSSERAGSVDDGTYSTHNAMSFRNMQTLEKVPHIDHYRDMHEMAKAMSCRPTLHELLEPEESAQLDDEEKLQSFIPPEVTPIIGKLGWIKGVLIRCILCILGVMLYLRLSWVSAQAGIGLGCAIVLLGSTVTTLTALSLCAISTNGEVKGGGAYFLISRSLGPEFGGSIGLIFSFANAVAAAMYIVGFAESVRDLLKEYKTHIFENSTNDVRVIALAAAVVLLGVVMVGVQFETKAQMILLVVLAVSLVSFILGTFFSPDEEKLSRGITGYKWSTFLQNLGPDWRKETFFSVFAIYFPAATGIMAGANISGDLADPQKSIPKGTLLAIAVTTVIYLGGVLLTGSTCVRDAPGAGNFTLPVNDTMASFISRPSAACISQGNCPFGLHNYFRVMELESIFSPLVTGGVFAATLSSALASLVSAPKIFQAICKDRLFPYITYFATGFGKSDEPRPGYFLSFFIACSLICIGDLNSIAPIISNFFLASYALINYACFDASFANSPGWRPAFKYYNMWLSLFGAVVCMSVMFLISWQTALMTYAIIFTLYVYLLRRKPDVNWGSSSQAHAYRNALNSIIRLNNIEEHVKNYRPQILALTGFPANRSLLVDFATNITKDNSMLICGHVITSTEVEKRYQTMQKFMNQAIVWLRCRKTKAFYVPVAADTVEQGVMSLLQLSGLAKLKPNIMLMGFKHDWRSCPGSEINSYVNMIHHAFDHMLAVGILRLSDGAEFNRQVSVVDSKTQICLTTNDSEPHMPLYAFPSFPQISSFINGQQGCGSRKQSLGSTTSGATNPLLSLNVNNAVTIKVVDESEDAEQQGQPPAAKNVPTPYAVIVDESAAAAVKAGDGGKNGAVEESENKKKISVKSEYLEQFRHKIKEPVIDVYWLFDDGGLTLLLPHILTQSKSYLEGGKMRVFTIASSRHQLEQEQRSMAALLSKFRIDYADVFVIPDITGRPKSQSQTEFRELIRPFLESGEIVSGINNNNNNNKHLTITEAELTLQKDRTNRQLRIRELLLKHSMNSTLIVLTMPIPRRNVFSNILYMAWLEILTKDMPPVLL